MKQPLSQAQRARSSEARKLQSGGRRMPGGVLSPQAAADLQTLQERGYASSATACIVRALREAASESPQPAAAGPDTPAPQPA